MATATPIPTSQSNPMLSRRKMATTDEKLCLQWNDFTENISSAFGDLRQDKEFTDVTLACEDGQQVEQRR